MKLGQGASVSITAKTYLIRCPPVAVLIVKLIGAKDLLRGAEDDIGSDLGPIGPAVRIRRDFLQLDIQPDELVLTGNDHQTAVLGRVNRAPHANVGEIRNGDQIHNTPDVIRGLSLQLQTELAPRPAPGAVAPDDVLGVHNLALRAALLQLFNEPVVGVVFLHEVTPEETVGRLAGGGLLLGGSLLLRKLPQLDGHGVGRVIVDGGLVDGDGLGEDATLDADGVLGVLLNVVEEPALDAALVHDDLLIAGEADDGVGDTVRPADGAVRAGVLEREG